MRRPARSRPHLAPGGSKPRDQGPTPETVRRQREALTAAGVTPGAALHNHGAIQVLLAGGHITPDQAATGEFLRAHWLAWRRLHNVPAPSARAIDYAAIGGGSGAEPCEREAERNRETEAMIVDALRSQPAACRSLLMAVTVDDDVLQGRAASPLLCQALDAIARVTQRKPKK